MELAHRAERIVSCAGWKIKAKLVLWSDHRTTRLDRVVKCACMEYHEKAMVSQTLSDLKDCPEFWMNVHWGRGLLILPNHLVMIGDFIMTIPVGSEYFC